MALMNALKYKIRRNIGGWQSVSWCRLASSQARKAPVYI